uniref:Uncharacterized protein n=1 Tax=viral metagenome TaxID=1070528 RepID=A0A6C0JIX4_9ZZZZ
MSGDEEDDGYKSDGSTKTAGLGEKFSQALIDGVGNYIKLTKDILNKKESLSAEDIKNLKLKLEELESELQTMIKANSELDAMNRGGGKRRSKKSKKSRKSRRRRSKSSKMSKDMMM